MGVEIGDTETVRLSALKFRLTSYRGGGRSAGLYDPPYPSPCGRRIATFGEMRVHANALLARWRSILVG